MAPKNAVALEGCSNSANTASAVVCDTRQRSPSALIPAFLVLHWGSSDTGFRNPMSLNRRACVNSFAIIFAKLSAGGGYAVGFSHCTYFIDVMRVPSG